MSMMRCHYCGFVVNTDNDPDAIQPYPSHPVRGAPDICVCEQCRERIESETAAEPPEATSEHRAGYADYLMREAIAERAKLRRENLHV